jgi:hypothetical protein
VVLKPEHSGPVTTPRLVERDARPDGNIIEVYEVDGELITVESWSVDEVTAPGRPAARR